MQTVHVSDFVKYKLGTKRSGTILGGGEYDNWRVVRLSEICEETRKFGGVIGNIGE